MLADAKSLVERESAAEQQLDLLDPVSPEDMAWSQDELGPNAGNLAVLKHARAQKRGRKKGSRNRRTEDFTRYIMQFGRDPAITLMEIQATPPEVLVERSRMIDPVKRQMSYADAQQLRTRCAEGLMPYIHGKKPVEIDLTANGDFNLIIPGVNMSEADAGKAADGTFILDADYSEVDGVDD